MPCPELQDCPENPSLTLHNVGYNVEIDAYVQANWFLFFSTAYRIIIIV